MEKTITLTKKEEKSVQDWAFKCFAHAHPVEAYDLNKRKFCNLMRKDGYNLNNEQIEFLINESR